MKHFDAQELMASAHPSAVRLSQEEVGDKRYMQGEAREEIWRPEVEKKERGGVDGWGPRRFPRGHATMARYVDKSDKLLRNHLSPVVNY